MAKMDKVKVGKKRADSVFPFEKENYVIFAIGIVFIIAGYIALAQPTVEGFLPLVVAPILLVVGYCVIVPFGILYKRSQRRKSTTEETSQTA